MKAEARIPIRPFTCVGFAHRPGHYAPAHIRLKNVPETLSVLEAESLRDQLDLAIRTAKRHRDIG